ncbi:hypothetical protein BZG01_00120 [Labilibaculum manganireducens]|uniref:Uncharacterized protein n=1 Tax=Labilibaculum manganireducens TaxID=1940525 RepID=A0A2N3IGI2_9BACT|nr:hypothetical protein [Labilibaculum manganireducens]PKQ69378.1 hypothetical protein BZG01_00120 [Labilibaculum manganireducens]
MKKSLLIIACFIFTISAGAQQKAFGDLYFGMTKKEAKTAYKANKENHRIEIGGWQFVASPYSCEFDADGLCGVSLYAKEVPFEKYLNAGNTELLLKEIKDVFTATGYTLIDEHVFWPKPNLMLSDSFCLIMQKDADQKYMIVRIPDANMMSQQSFNVWIDLIPYRQADKLAEMKNKAVAEKADELKGKL